jgi:hypothetical protein
LLYLQQIFKDKDVKDKVLTRLTSEELLAAKKRVNEERIIGQQRIAEELALEANRANDRLAWLVEARQKYSQIESVVLALYEEINKLSRKWPTMPITQKTLEMTNKVIVTFRDLLKNEDDDFAKDITEIIPAGDLPETRDILITLGQIQAALKSFEGKYRNEWNKTIERDGYNGRFH